MNQLYLGGELELFAGATNWKSYIGDILRPFIAGRVLEVGSGLGANVAFLYSDRVESWLCLEPDPLLAGRIAGTIATGGLRRTCEIAAGTVGDVDGAALFDTILYLDVLEHIAEDHAELVRARSHLAPGGYLVVLAPAHQFLFSPFDRAIGHHRRYTRSSLHALKPRNCTLVLNRMLDSAGFFASLANRLLLSAAMPSARQVAIWDKIFVPVSRRLDRALGYRFGKSVLTAWRAAN